MEVESYPVIRSQPIPNDYVWDTNAFEAEKMIIYVSDKSRSWSVSILCLLVTFVVDGPHSSASW